METAEQLIEFIRTARKTTPVKIYVQGTLSPVNTAGLQVFAGTSSAIIIGDYAEVLPYLEAHREQIAYCHLETAARHSAVPLADLTQYNARIEPGAIIRERVTIGERAVVMMGAVINIGAVVGAGSMVDMNAVLGGRAEVGANCHIGAGAVIAGVIEPPGSRPTVIADAVVVGANAVVLEGVWVGEGAVVAAGAVVTEDVPSHAVVAGIPARIVKMKDAKTSAKTQIVEALREIKQH